MLRPILLQLSALAVALVLVVVLPFELRDEQVAALWQVTPVYLALAALTFVVGQATGNVSQVDKLWSVVPMLYAWHFAALSGFDPRVTLMAGLVTVWGARLTFNFGRRGGYTWPPWRGEEDYRWEVLRRKPLFAGRPWAFSLFNLLFICGYQMTLIYLFTLPVVVAWTGEPLGVLDAVLAVALLALVAVEFVADQQQWTYQTEKHRQLREEGRARGEHAVGFVHTGLWRHSRHPNYAAEQGVWLVVYLFSVVATGQLFNPTALGVILLMLLFLGSSDFSESVTADKYPQYREYIACTPRFLPSPLGARFGPVLDEGDEAGVRVPVRSTDG